MNEMIIKFCDAKMLKYECKKQALVVKESKQHR